VNCHACIAACPVKYCNRAIGNVVEIDANRCIGCGSCIGACKHDARLPTDDWTAFWNDLHSGVKMISVVAPAVAAAFPHRYKNLVGWLKSVGVSAVFDVSFGAELTIQSYLRHIEQNHPKTVIAQPCPAIVAYIELYRPELLEWLSPAGSPMHHAMRMVRNQYPQYNRHKIAVISPCIAKKREFEATGLGDYNVTMRSLETYFDSHRIDLSCYPATEFDGPQAERAVLFSTPGGLRDTLERWSGDAAKATRKIEGCPSIYHYLDHLPESVRDGVAPLLVDCLSCEKGCNGGTGTPARALGIDRIESLVAERAREARTKFVDMGADDAEAQAAVIQLLRERDDPEGFRRTYTDRSGSVTLRRPSPAELQATYATMSKFGPADILNCGACGYGTCEGMAVAIDNGLNRRENCVFYLGTMNREQERRAAALKAVMTDFESTVAKVSQAAQTTGELERVSEAIVRLSQQTHIVALNARIEAARAGAAGAAFSVVSSAVRDLAGGIRREAEAIEPCSETLRNAFAAVVKEVEALGKRVVGILETDLTDKDTCPHATH
jgi:Na+-translocating ferredoxin:NAD+ oxidoreductase RNF subunit RnfB